MDIPASLQDFSLVQGGSFLHLRRRLRLLWPGRSRPLWRLLTLMLLGWLPLLLLTLVRAEPARLRAFLLDFHTHVQLLLSLPVLIAAERFVDTHLAMAVRQFVSAELVEPGSLPALEAAARDAKRLRSLDVVEAGLLLLSYALTAIKQFPGRHTEWIFADSATHLTPAGTWYVAVGLPIFRFLVLRWFWRGTVWARFLFRVSRLRLSLRPTHPDCAGGLRFLSGCQASFAPIVFAVACSTISATRQLIRASPTEEPLKYASPLLALVLVAVVLVFCPLLSFWGPLVKAKRRGELQFSALASLHSRDFERRWFAPRGTNVQPPDDRERPLLGAAEFSSLIDLGSSFDVMDKMWLLPLSRRPLLAVAGAALTPLAPLLIVDRQLLNFLWQLMQTVL